VSKNAQKLTFSRLIQNRLKPLIDKAFRLFAWFFPIPPSSILKCSNNAKTLVSLVFWGILINSKIKFISQF
jgi:hypothetical protein